MTNGFKDYMKMKQGEFKGRTLESLDNIKQELKQQRKEHEKTNEILTKHESGLVNLGSRLKVVENRSGGVKIGKFVDWVISLILGK